MQQCKLCYRTHEDNVESCDCGGELTRERDPWLLRTVQHYLCPVCPQCGQLMQEELTAENNGFGLVTATMRCSHCQQWHEVQRVGLPYMLLLLIGIVLFFFLLQANENTFLIKFILGVVNLVLALQRWLWPSASSAPSAMTSPGQAAPEPIVLRRAVKNFATWLDGVSWRQNDRSDRPGNEQIPNEHTANQPSNKSQNHH